MQKSAPEVLRIKVLRVDVTDGPSGKDVSALVQVLKVGRTQSGLKADDLVTIRYELPTRPPGWVGPGPVPLLADDEERIAYLQKAADSPDYAPAAGAMTFDRFH